MNSQWLNQSVWWQNIQSHSCLLTRRQAHDAPFMRTLWADQAFMHAFHRLAPPLPAADYDLVAVLNREYHSTIDKSRALHWVVRTPHGEPWGLLSLTDISLQHKRAEVLLGVLPGVPFGLTTAAMLMLFQFYFRVMKFNKLYSLVFADNRHSLRGTLHLGFKQEGLLRKHTFDPLTRSHVDVVQMGLLADEAFSLSNTRLMHRLLKNQTDARQGAGQAGG